MQVLHENQNYQVWLDGGDDGLGNFAPTGYKCVNRNTGVSEHACEKIVEAIDFVEHSNSYLENNLWKWIAKRGNALEDPAEMLAGVFAGEDDDDDTDLH